MNAVTSSGIFSNGGVISPPSQCEEVNPCSVDATRRNYLNPTPNTAAVGLISNNNKNNVCSSSIIASTSFDLVDLRSHNHHQHQNKNNHKQRKDVYANFNPGYKCVSPPDGDYKVQYPPPSMGGGNDRNKKQRQKAALMSQTEPDLSHIITASNAKRSSKSSSHISSNNHHQSSNVYSNHPHHHPNNVEKCSDILREFRVANSTSSSRLEELFYRGVAARQRSPRSSWNGGESSPSPTPSQLSSASSPCVSIQSQQQQQQQQQQQRKLSSPSAGGGGFRQSPVRSPTPPYGTPLCSPLAFESLAQSPTPQLQKPVTSKQYKGKTTQDNKPPDVRPKLKKDSERLPQQQKYEPLNISKMSSPTDSISPPNSISPRDSWHSDAGSSSGRSTPLYWELEMPPPAPPVCPSPIRHVDPDLKTTPLKSGSSSSKNHEVLQNSSKGVKERRMRRSVGSVSGSQESIGGSSGGSVVARKSSTPGITPSRSSTPGIPLSRSSTPGIPLSRSNTPGIPLSRSSTPGIPHSRSATPGGISLSRSATPTCKSERSTQNPPNSPRLPLRSSSVNLQSIQHGNSSATGKSNSHNASPSSPSSRQHTTKVQVWIPQAKPKVKPKPKRDHHNIQNNKGALDTSGGISNTKEKSCDVSSHHPESSSHNMSMTHVCNTLPRSACGHHHGNGAGGSGSSSVLNSSTDNGVEGGTRKHNEHQQATPAQNGHHSKPSLKSQSCGHISSSIPTSKSHNGKENDHVYANEKHSGVVQQHELSEAKVRSITPTPASHNGRNSIDGDHIYANGGLHQCEKTQDRNGQFEQDSIIEESDKHSNKVSHSTNTSPDTSTCAKLGPPSICGGGSSTSTGDTGTNSSTCKGRSQTPPRVLSPSQQKMSCEVIADI